MWESHADPNGHGDSNSNSNTHAYIYPDWKDLSDAETAADSTTAPVAREC